MDIVSYALAKKMASSAVSGISSMTVDGTTLNINTVSGETLQIVFPSASSEEGVSLIDTSNGSKYKLYVANDKLHMEVTE